MIGYRMVDYPGGRLCPGRVLAPRGCAAGRNGGGRLGLPCRHQEHGHAKRHTCKQIQPIFSHFIHLSKILAAKKQSFAPVFRSPLRNRTASYGRIVDDLYINYTCYATITKRSEIANSFWSTFFVFFLFIEIKQFFVHSY